MTIRSFSILADASLPLLTEAFPAPFKLTTYTNAREVPGLLTNQAIFITRSTLTENEALIGKNHPQIVATASSGSEHLDYNFLNQHHIEIFDAKGSNAHSVADYVLSCMALLMTRQHVPRKTIGMIGAGAVGSLVHQRLTQLDFNVICYDPIRALIDNHFHSVERLKLFDCDVICVHANYHETLPFPSVNLLDQSFLSQLKPHAALINASRGGIVNEKDLINLIKQGQKITYCTDVYQNEPAINPEIVALATLCTPHIAGHSIEAKQRAVTMLSEKIHDYYGLPYPFILKKHRDQSASSNPKLLRDEKHIHWKERMLSHYDPSIETNRLKASDPASMRDTFLTLRKQHDFRHDFVMVR